MRRIWSFADVATHELLDVVAKGLRRSEAPVVRHAIAEQHGRHFVMDVFDDLVGSVDDTPSDIDAVVYGPWDPSTLARDL